MSFLRPQILWALALLVPYAAAEIFGTIRGRALAGSFAPKAGSERSGRAWFRRRLARALSGAWTWAFTVGALAGPSWGFLPSSGIPSGVEAALVLDVSNSMLSSDIPPSRISAARDTARALVRMRGEVTFSVVAFKGSAVLLCPGTDDPDALDQALDWATPSALSASGTSAASGIRAALDAFSPDPGLAKYIVIFSDGDDLAGGAAKAAREARDQGVRILAAGCGGLEEIPAQDESGGPVKLPDGSAARTALRAAALRQWASDSDGQYVDVSDPGAAAAIADALDGKPGAKGSRLAPKPADRTELFALLALLGAIVRALASIPSAPEKRVRGGRRAAVVSLVALTLADCSIPHLAVLSGNRLTERGRFEEAIAKYLSAGEETGNGVVSFNLGGVYSRMGERSAAEPLYERAQDSKDPRVAAAAFHNQGVQLFESLRFDEAADSFKRALRLAPEDLETKRALELALSTLTAKVAPRSRQNISAQKDGRDDALFSLLRRAESDWFRPAEPETPEERGLDH